MVLRMLICWNLGIWLIDGTEDADLLEIQYANLLVFRMFIYWNWGFWFNETKNTDLLELGFLI